MEQQYGNASGFHYRREIRATDIAEEILRKLWLVVVCAVVFCAVFTGYKYKEEKAAAHSSQTTVSISLTEEEITAVNNYLEYQAQLEYQSEYMENSIRMQINPFAEDRVTIQFYITGGEATAMDAQAALHSYISNGSLANAVSDQYPDIEAMYLAELIYYQSYEDESVSVDSEEEGQAVVFDLYVTHTSAEEAQALADAAVDALMAYQEKSQEVLGSYELEIISRDATKLYDSTLLSAQTTRNTAITTLQTTIASAEAELSSAQLQVAAQGGITESSEEETQESTQTVEVSVSLDKTTMLLGALVGIVIGILLLLIQIILRGTIDSAGEFQRAFSLSLFGQVDLYEKKNPLVELLRRLTHRRKRMPLEEEKRLAVSGIASYCRKNGIARVLLAGSLEDIAQAGWLAECAGELSGCGIETGLAGGMLSTPASIEKLAEYENVILVERLRKSRYEEVGACLRTCAERSRKVCGVLVLN